MSALLRFTLLALAIWQTGLAQNWALFPPQERAYYRNLDDQTLFDYYPDSVVAQGNATAHYIGAKAYALAGLVPATCQYDSVVSSFGQGLAVRDTVWRQGDMWYAFSAGDSLWFKPMAQPGARWAIPLPNQASLDSLVVTCLATSDSSFWGQSDSVKSFAVQGYQGGSPVSTPLDSLAPVLSRSHGLLAFAPLSQWLTTPQRAVQQGRRAGGQKLGYTADFLDFFGQWQPGDLRKYETTVAFSGEPLRRERDSITAVSASANQVVLTYDRQHYRGPYTANGTSFPDSLWTLTGLRDTFTRGEDATFLDSVALQWLLRVSPTYLREDRRMAALGNMSTLRRLDMVFDACAFQPSVSGAIIDDQRLAEGLGLVYQESGTITDGNRATTTRRLIAWDTQARGQSGNLSPLALGLRARRGETGFQAVPTPSRGQVRLYGLQPQQPTTVRVLSAQGQCLAEVHLAAGEDRLALGRYPSGLYLLQIRQRQQQGYARAIKQ